MLKLKTERQVKLIVNNVVRACADITKLNKTGYNYIYVCSGFIAHYNRHGFMDFYSMSEVDKKFGVGRSLREHILCNQQNNQWGNFRVGDRDYEYYLQKSEIYNAICKKIK